MREQYKIEFEHMQHFIEQKRHLGMDIEEYFSVIHKYSLCPRLLGVNLSFGKILRICFKY